MPSAISLIPSAPAQSTIACKRDTLSGCLDSVVIQLLSNFNQSGLTSRKRMRSCSPIPKSS